MMSTALKDLAVEMSLFVESSTQTNAKANDEDGAKDETVIRGSRAIIDKCDLACIVTPISENDLNLLATFIEKTGLMPSHCTDIYKVRRGKYTKVKIWSVIDLGTCRKTDLFVTNLDYKVIDEFRTVDFTFSDSNADAIMGIVNELNSNKGTLTSIQEYNEPEPVELIDLNTIKEESVSFDDLL